MKRQDIINIVVTFIVGVIVGAYLFVYGFNPQYEQVTNWTEEVGTFSVAGEAYGGCKRGGICASFQITDRGAYKTFPAVSAGEERIPTEGILPSAVYRDLRNAFTGDSLVVLEEPVTSNGCASATNGIDYRLRVSLSSEQFVLDTCTTALADDKPTRDLIKKLVSTMSLE